MRNEHFQVAGAAGAGDINKLITDIGELKTKIDSIEGNLKTTLNESIEENIDDLDDELISNILSNITSKFSNIPSFLKQHKMFFLLAIAVVLLFFFMFIGTFVLTFLNSGFLCIVLNKINQLDLMILKKK